MHPVQKKFNTGSIGGWVIATLLFIIDRTVKVQAYHACAEGGCPSFHINTAIFAIIPFTSIYGAVLLGIGIGVLVWGCVHVRGVIVPIARPWFDASCAVLILGAMSNVMDRLWVGGVIDYMRLAQTVYNGADIMIALGVIGVMVILSYYGNNSFKRGGKRS